MFDSLSQYKRIDLIIKVIKNHPYKQINVCMGDF